MLSCSVSGVLPALAAASASSTRFLISPAALRVNVIATTSSGASTRDSRVRKRWINSSVLPDPAGACTMNERVGSSARLRASRSLRSRASVIGAGRSAIEQLAHAAEQTELAAAAGLAALLRRYRDLTGTKRLREPLQRRTPVADELAPVVSGILEATRRIRSHTRSRHHVCAQA